MSSKDYAVMPYSDYKGACDAIREKDGSSGQIKSGELRSKILAIETGADTSVVTATAPDILSGKIIVDKNGNPLTGTMPNRGAGGGSISSVSQKITIPQGYYNGSGSVAISATEQAKIIESNIAEGVTLLGKTGTYNGKFAWGTNTWDGIGVQTYTLSGLPFKPKIVYYSSPTYTTSSYKVFGGLFIDTTKGEKYMWYLDDGNYNGSSSNYYYFTCDITNDGFYLKATSSTSRVFQPNSYSKNYWVAIG